MGTPWVALLGLEHCVGDRVVNILVQHPHTRDEISGVLTFVNAFRSFAVESGHKVTVVSTKETAPAGWLSLIRASDAVLMNSNDPRFALLVKLAGRRLVLRFHFNFFMDDHMNFAPGSLTSRSMKGIYEHLFHTLVWPQTQRSRHWHFATAYRLAGRYLTFALADQRNACSRFLAETIGGCSVIYNWLEKNETPCDRGWEARHWDFAFLGRMHHGKGIFTMIEALGQVASRGLLPKTIMIGDGPDMQTAIHRRDQLGLQDAIHFYGAVAYEEVPHLLTQVRWLVQPSEWLEALSYTVLEAAAVGTPCIGADLGGIPEAAGPGASLFKPGDASALAELMNRVHGDSVAWEQASQSVREHFVNTFAAKAQGELLLRALKV